jgi:acetyl-CoA carboxylase biotin carboxyl carrier protein
MEIDDLKELMELLKDTDITELQIEKDGTKIKIKREKFFAPLELPSAVQKKEEIKKETGIGVQTEGGLITITSPLVGTFYLTPSPEAEPFVTVGSRIRKGQVICIIEAMKLMNEIESEVDGVIVKILVESGNPVEYGEPLFLVEPTG